MLLGAMACVESAVERSVEVLVAVPDQPGFDFDAFVADATVRLRRALVARYGVEIGVEACSEAIAWAWENRDRLPGMPNAVGYLYRVGQTAARKQTRWRNAPRFPGNAPEVSDVPLPDPALAGALAKLPDDQRAAVVLVHAHGYRYAEAAELLDIPLTTLKNHLHRGAAKLRRLLGERR